MVLRFSTELMAQFGNTLYNFRLLLFFFGNFFFGWDEIAPVDFSVVYKIGAVFVDEDFDAAGDWYRDDCSDEPESIDADGDSGEDDECRKTHATTLNFWRNNIRFDLEINDGIYKEDGARPWSIEAE